MSRRQLPRPEFEPVRLGYVFGDYPTPVAGSVHLFDSVVAQAQAAEAAGFDSVWVPDHLMQIPLVGSPDEPMLECYTTLAALAALTSRVRLGAFVGGAAYRNPTLLGKAVTTLDIISHGRAMFGIGAGWYEEEHANFGYELGTIPDRFARLVDVLEIVESMFANETTTYAGRYFHADGALNSPRSLQPGGPPVLVGGSGEKRTLRLVAEYADICNVGGHAETVRHLMHVLDRHCQTIHRDPASICRTCTCVVIVRDTEEEAEAAMPDVYRSRPPRTQPVVMGTRLQVAEQLRARLEAGIDGLMLSCAAQDRRPEYAEVLAEVAAEARA